MDIHCQDHPEKRTFHPETSEENFDNLTKRCFADNTEKKVKWVMGIFCQWREHKLAQKDCDARIRDSDL